MSHATCAATNTKWTDMESILILRSASTASTDLSRGRPFKDEDQPELCLKIQSVLRSKHTASRL